MHQSLNMKRSIHLNTQNNKQKNKRITTAFLGFDNKGWIEVKSQHVFSARELHYNWIKTFVQVRNKHLYVQSDQHNLTLKTLLCSLNQAPKT
jgi:CMP-N-acetylneuraminic acid synthetase